jgi:hypothetical protein
MDPLDSTRAPEKVGEGSPSAMLSFHRQSDFWGRLSLWTVVCASLMPPVYLSYFLGFHPGWGVVIGGLIGYASFIGIMWFLEPITYYPALGKSGTYIAFLTGNVANMCLPCSASAQEAVAAEPGSAKAEVAGTLAIAAASLTNIIIVTGVVLAGAWILTILPQPVQDALQFILPAIYGGVLGQFALKNPLYGVVAICFGVAVLLSPVTALLKVVLCVFSTVLVAVLLESRKAVREARVP